MRKRLLLRLTIGTALPPFLGLVVLIVIDLFGSALFKDEVVLFRGISEASFVQFGVLILFSYGLIGLQSLVYSLLMEWVGQWILQKSRSAEAFRYVGFSVLLGVAAGLTLRDTGFSGIGGFVGLVTGLILLIVSRRTHNSSFDKDASSMRLSN